MTRPLLPRIALPLAVGLGALTMSACGGDDGTVSSDSTLLVVNDSDFAIEQLYITDVNASGWGPNLLADMPVLAPGEDILLTDITCDFHDVKMVDEDGATCQVLDVDLCFDDATWVIHNDTCSIFNQDDAKQK